MNYSTYLNTLLNWVLVQNDLDRNVNSQKSEPFLTVITITASLKISVIYWKDKTRGGIIARPERAPIWLRFMLYFAQNYQIYIQLYVP